VIHPDQPLQFIQSGRFLKEHQAGGGTGRMQLGMQRAVPVATERFHDALDELENEVRLAQAVLRRDLASLKDARRKRAAAAKQHEAERARLASEARNPPTRTMDLPVQVGQANKPNKAITPGVPEAALENTSEPIAKTDDPAPAPKSEPEHLSPPIKTSAAIPPRDPLVAATPTTANPQDTDFDFDAIFDDAMDTTADNAIDHHATTDTSANIELNLDDANDAPSLLRGLEDFAKDSDDDENNNKNKNKSGSNPLPDTSMDMDLDMPHSPPKPSQTSAPPTIKLDPSQPPRDMPPIKDKKVSTMATPVATTITTTQEDLMATMAADNLEDLFNMDGYENPENSSFDDAFFNFND